jgi:hypothetical protein
VTDAGVLGAKTGVKDARRTKSRALSTQSATCYEPDMVTIILAVRAEIFAAADGAKHLAKHG